jgi:hypothetical protein
MGNIYSQIFGYSEQINQREDNIVTKDELEKYISQLSYKIDKNSDEIVVQNKQLVESREEAKKWKNAYITLHTNYEKLLDDVRSRSLIMEPSNISSEAIKDYIKTEIIDTDANIGLIPDILEKKIYLTVCKTIMKSLESMSNTTSINLLNHKISFYIRPINVESRSIVTSDPGKQSDEENYCYI